MSYVRDADGFMAQLLDQLSGFDVAPIIHRLSDGRWCCHPWGKTHHSEELSHTGATIREAIAAAVAATKPLDKGETDAT